MFWRFTTFQKIQTHSEPGLESYAESYPGKFACQVLRRSHTGRPGKTAWIPRWKSVENKPPDHQTQLRVYETKLVQISSFVVSNLLGVALTFLTFINFLLLCFLHSLLYSAFLYDASFSRILLHSVKNMHYSAAFQVPPKRFSFHLRWNSEASWSYLPAGWRSK